jgi:hypothetical protein
MVYLLETGAVAAKAEAGASVHQPITAPAPQLRNRLVFIAQSPQHM